MWYMKIHVKIMYDNWKASNVSLKICLNITIINFWNHSKTVIIYFFSKLKYWHFSFLLFSIKKKKQQYRIKTVELQRFNLCCSRLKTVELWYLSKDYYGFWMKTICSATICNESVQSTVYLPDRCQMRFGAGLSIVRSYRFIER